MNFGPLPECLSNQGIPRLAAVLSGNFQLSTCLIAQINIEVHGVPQKITPQYVTSHQGGSRCKNCFYKITARLYLINWLHLKVARLSQYQTQDVGTSDLWPAVCLRLRVLVGNLAKGSLCRHVPAKRLGARRACG